MESREALPPSTQPAPQHHGMMMMMNHHHHHTHNSFAAAHSANSGSLIFNPHPTSMIPNPTFPFNSTITPPQSQSLQQQSKFHESLNSSPPFDGSSSPVLKHSAFSMESSSPSRKKRGRPRKYVPDGNIALALAPAPNSPSGHRNSEDMTSGELQTKKHKGRPPGSGKRQLNALGIKGVGFTPHVILVNPGEDIASKIMDFSQQGPRTVCVLAANGAICNAILRQQASSGGTVSYEGRFEIVSLSGSFLLSESNGNRTRSGGLSVSLAGSDGRVLGGVVAGMLMAVSPVQVIVGSFIANEKKREKASNSAPKADPAVAVVVPVTEGSPSHSQGGNLSESCSYENDEAKAEGGGHRDCSTNAAPQPIHGMPMYSSSMAWANSLKMHPN